MISLPGLIRKIPSISSLSRHYIRDFRAARRVTPACATASIRWKSSISVVIVGSGPAGCYTAKYLQRYFQQADENMSISIDMLDRLPTPFGLVRSGVAPDHPEVKNVQNEFSALFETEKLPVSFFGNVKVGRDVSLNEIRRIYDIVVLAYGCESDRKLQIPGEDSLEGVISARGKIYNL